jgi:hypothetical protein
MRLGSEGKQGLTTREVKALIVWRLIKQRDERIFTLPFCVQRDVGERDKRPTPSQSEDLLWHSLALREENNLREEQAERQPDIVFTVFMFM